MNNTQLLLRVDPKTICPVIASFILQFYERTKNVEFALWVEEFTPHLENSITDQQVMLTRLEMACAWVESEATLWMDKRNKLIEAAYELMKRDNYRELITKFDKEIVLCDREFVGSAQEMIKKLLLVKNQESAAN